MQTRLTERGRQMLALIRRGVAGEDLDTLAKEAGVTRSTLIWWRSKLRRHLDRDRDSAPFIELKIDESRTVVPFVLHAAGIRVDVPLGFDADELGRLISVLRSC